MATLFDKISQPATQLPENNQSAIEKLLAAKKGKVATSGPVDSNLGEQAVQQQGADALKQGAATTALVGAQQNVERTDLERGIAQAGKEQQQGFNIQRSNIESGAIRSQADIAGQEQQQLTQLDASKQRKLRSISANAEAKLRELSAQSGMEIDDIFSNFARSNKDLAAREDASRLEHIGTLLALQDRKYTDELNRIGEKRRLYDQANWNKERADIIYGANLASVLDDLQFKRGEDATTRSYQDQLAQIDIDSAIRMAEAAARDNATRAMFEAGTTIDATDWSKFSKKD